MVKSEKKGIVFGAFDSHFDKYGYKGVKSGGDPTYVMKTENYVVTFFINFLDLGGIYIYQVLVSQLPMWKKTSFHFLGKQQLKRGFFMMKRSIFYLQSLTRLTLA